MASSEQEVISTLEEEVKEVETVPNNDNDNYYDQSQIYEEEDDCQRNNNQSENININNNETPASINSAQQEEDEEKAKKDSAFVDAQSDLCKKIFSSSNGLNIYICVKLEELITKKDKLNIDDLLNNEKLIESLKDLNENCLDAFEEFANGEEVKAEKPTEAVTVIEGEQRAETIAEPATDEPKQNKLEFLIDSVEKWKQNNADKLNSGLYNSNSYDKEFMNTNGHRHQHQIQPRPGPNEEKLKEILARTGYSHEVSSGQRKYGGPPPDWTSVKTETTVEMQNINEETNKTESEPVKTDDTLPKQEENSTETIKEDEPKKNESDENASNNNNNNNNNNSVSRPAHVLPPQGCECFVGKLPRDLFEDELIPLFEKQGRIWDLRLMIDPNTGFSKGYCFVTYCEKQSAQACAKNLNDFEIRPGKGIRVNLSVANIKLFIGNIPKTKSKEELKQEFCKIVDGVSEVIIYNQGETENEKFKNRGFCFIEFTDHKSASMAKRKLSSQRFNRIFNREIAVDWADPSDEPDEETMAKVKVLYVKNLSAEVTEEEVQQLFEQYGKLERVRKMKDYAFVHFEQRDDAVKAMEEQQAKTLGKNQIEISLARPLTEKKKQAQQKRQDKKFNDNINNNNMNGNNWNNGNNHRQNNRSFGDNQNGGQMNRYNYNNNNNNNRNNGRFNNNNNNNNQRNQRNFKNNNNNNSNNRNNFNNNRNNYNDNNRNNNQMSRGGGGGGGDNKAMFKRKNDSSFSNYNNNNNNNKRGRFNSNNSLNSMDTLVNNGTANNNSGGWNNNNNNGNFNQQTPSDQFMQQNQQMSNDVSNEWYSDNFNSNQWV